LEMGSMFDPWW